MANPVTPDTPTREMTLAEWMAQLPVFHRAHREYVELLQDRALPPARPAEPTSEESDEEWANRDNRETLEKIAAECFAAGFSTPDGTVLALVRRVIEAAKSAPLPSGEPTSEAVAWHQHPSVTEVARQLHRHLATANRSAQWLNEAYELCQRLGDSVAAISTHPAPLPSADVEAAIQDYGNRLLVFQSLGGIGNARALDDARAALLALYRAPVQSPSREVDAAVTDLVNGIEDAANACHDATVWRDEGTWDAHIQPHIARLLAPFRAPVQTSGAQETRSGLSGVNARNRTPATSPEGADHNG